MIILIIVILILLISYIYKTNETYLDLPFKVRYSKKIGSDGIFATRNIKKDDIIEKCPSIIDDVNNIKGELNNYAFKLKNKAAIVFGYCSIFNHSDNYNIDYFFKGTKLFLKARRDIEKGEELYVNYGNEWFKNKKNIKKI